MAHRYDLMLLPTGARRHDAKTKNGRLVQIKTTQREAVGMSSRPRHLVVVKLNGNGSIDEIYNGPGALAWDEAGPRQKNGQRVIGVGRLRALMATVGEEDRIPEPRDE